VPEVSQANVASRLGYNGVVNDDYIAHLPPSLEGKSLVKIGRDDEVTGKITVQSDTFLTWGNSRSHRTVAQKVKVEGDFG